MVRTNTAAEIVVSGLTKRFGAVRAVDDLTFTVEPGSVTGFLGPNGAGKTTTLRMLLGLVSPDAGTARIGGRRYADLPRPGSAVGAMLEADGFHAARSGRSSLRSLCAVNGYPGSRADEVLDLVGLADAARRRVKGYSLGMKQRLSLAAALLGDPPVLVLDEPANGLDPEGIVWMRKLLRDLADEGRTVLVSSHVLTEMQQLVDRVVIVNKGRSVRQGSVSELAGLDAGVVTVRSPQADSLAVALEVAALRVERLDAERLRVSGASTSQVGRIAHRTGAELHQLAQSDADLENVFLALTGETNRKEPACSA
ncbi:MAG: ABC transporter ATP-binding protein [Stackebrandtia sp.]